jgi:hypothetical protein
MADQKITELTVGVPVPTDLIPYVSDPGGTPITKAALKSNVSGDFLGTLNGAEISITSAVPLTIGRMHVISGSTNFTPTLPATSGNTGKFIGARFTNTGVTTIDGNASETIDGALTRAYYQDQAAVWLCDGSNWFSVYQKVAPRRASLNTLALIHSKAQTLTMSALQVYGFYNNQTSPANADYLTGSVFLNKGTYTCNVIGASSAGNGLLDWTLDGVSQTTGQDWYSGSTVYNVSKTFTLTVPFTGYHTLRGTVNGKNGSSSNYYYIITQIEIYPSAD